jgi:hypothetical protein
MEIVGYVGTDRRDGETGILKKGVRDCDSLGVKKR